MEEHSSSNASQWWKYVKRLIGMKSKSSYSMKPIADNMFNGDIKALANKINDTF